VLIICTQEMKLEDKHTISRIIHSVSEHSNTRFEAHLRRGAQSECIQSFGNELEHVVFDGELLGRNVARHLARLGQRFSVQTHQARLVANIVVFRSDVFMYNYCVAT